MGCFVNRVFWCPEERDELNEPKIGGEDKEKQEKTTRFPLMDDGPPNKRFPGKKSVEQRKGSYNAAEIILLLLHRFKLYNGPTEMPTKEMIHRNGKD